MRLTTRLTVLLLGVLGIAGPLANASAQEAARATVEGRVYDSLAHAPLAGAAVSIVSADTRVTYGAVSDSVGHYAVAGVEPGTYMIGFFHPVLDSIGIESPVHRVTIDRPGRSSSKRIDLGVPGADRIHDAVCGARTKHDSTGVFVGHVQDATTRAFLNGAVISAQWIVLGVAGGRLQAETPTAAAKSNASGWFAFCGLPADTPISFVASSGPDSSGAVSFTVPAHSAAHRDLFVGAVEHLTRAPIDSSATPDSLRMSSETPRRGPARLHGVARDAASHLPLPDVQVTVVGTGLRAMANERGEFSLGQLPLGTQTLTARKVGYLPADVLVDLLARDTARVEFELPTLKSVLDTVRVTASRVYSSDKNGFYRRQHAGFGHYFDATQIARINPLETSDLVTRIPGVRTTSTGFDRIIRMRQGANFCTPTIFIDGFIQNNMNFDDLDLMVHPDQIEGIEIYTSVVGIPPEFAQGFDPCGVFAVWTQPRKPRPRDP